MKKILVFAVAIMMVAGMSYAEDRLSLNGSFFVRGWDQQGYGSKYSPNYKDDDASEASWWEQRLRLGGKIAVADDVSVNFRMDIGEGVWGLDYSPGSVARPGNAGTRIGANKIDFDRAYLQIDKEMWDLTAGQQYMALGVAQVFDVNATGFNLGFKFDPIKVSLLYAKFDENGSTNDDDNNDDVNRYGANVGYSADTWSAKAFFIMGDDGTDVDDSPYAFGLNGAMTMGMFNLQGELAFLDGDTNNGNTDYTGMQLFLDGNANVTEMIKVGVEFFYANDADNDEIQLTNLGDWDTFTPMGYNTPMSGFVTGMPSWDVFDPFGIGGGVVGGTIYADFNIMEGLSAGGKFGYFEPKDDDRRKGADLMAWNLWIKYMIASNTYVTGTYLVSSPDADDDSIYEDDAKALVGELIINF